MIMSDVEEPSKIKTWYEEFKKRIKTWYKMIKNCYVFMRCYKKVKEIFTSETKKEDEIRYVFFFISSQVHRF